MIRILMISNPASLHTRIWTMELEKRGVEVDSLFVEDWIDRSGPVPLELYTNSRLLKLPSKGKMLIHSVRERNLGALYRDVLHHTRLHQSLKILGKEVAKVYLDGCYDIIHCHDVASSLLLAHASGMKPYSGTAWGSDIHVLPERHPYLKALLKRAFSEASFLHVESEKSAKRVLELAPTVGPKLFTSTWGIDTNEFKPDVEFMKTQAKLGIPKGRIILSLRVLSSLYRIDTILRAFAIIANEFPDAILVIGSDGPEKNDLIRLAGELNISERTVFTGFIDHDDKIALYSNSYIYVQFPSSDGVSISALEAISSGLPIISSNVGETSVLTKHLENGYLIDGDSPRDMAIAMRFLLKDTELRNKMSIASRELATTQHDREIFFKRFMKKVEEVVREFRNS